MAVNAGVDMSMIPSDYSFYDLLKEAVAKASDIVKMMIFFMWFLFEGGKKYFLNWFRL